MYIILGGTGHVGSAVAANLLKHGETVKVVAHNPNKAENLRNMGADIAVADVHDSDGLRRIFRQGKRLFVLNPPADVAKDTDVEERRTISSILASLDDTGLEKIVAESTFGAQPGDQIGDLGTLYDLEQGLKTKEIPVSVIRAAYYMSNWDASLETARKQGVVHTLFPIDFAIPMVAPADIGQLAAELLREPITQSGLHYVEGPLRYTSADVAAAFSNVLEKPVEAITTPREEWTNTFELMGFSDAAAGSYTGMAAKTLNGVFPPQNESRRGATSLRSYISDLVRHSQ